MFTVFLQECGNRDIDFREIQCQEYNRLRFRGWYFNWRAYGDKRRKNGNQIVLISLNTVYSRLLVSKSAVLLDKIN